VTRAEGDVHPLGNPHYWLDPENGLRIAKGIRDKLSEMRSSDAAYFAQRYDSFEQRLKQADEKWLAEMKPYAGRKSSPITAPGPISPNTSASMSWDTSSPAPASPEPAAHCRVDRPDEARRRKAHSC